MADFRILVLIIIKYFVFRENIGVPQGSVLGPIFFLIFIDDLLKQLKCNVSVFADDLFIHNKIFNKSTQIRKLNNDLQNIYKWVYLWHVIFYSTKFKLINFKHVKIIIQTCVYVPTTNELLIFYTKCVITDIFLRTKQHILQH